MGKKILLIDDDADFRDAVRTLLGAEGYTIFTADDGKAGFETAKKELPQLILLDVMMTHKTEGFDTARHFKDDEKTKNIPIILVTGIKKDMGLAYDFKPDDEWLPVKQVLEKPVEPDTLLHAVRAHIGS